MKFPAIIFTTLLGAGSLVAQDAAPATPAAIRNWQDARFGMFIHWGPVSLKGTEISWSRGVQVPVEEYDNLYKQFNPTKFNADAWVAVAKAAGMKYIVLTTKHHDGFCLWDTKHTDYNIMHTPFQRDVVKELSAACKQGGIAFGTYYSTTDWHHPDFPLTSPGGNVARPKSDLEAYTKYLKAQTTELLANYGPLFTLWYDVPQKFDATRGAGVINLARSIQPDIVINNRTGHNGDYDTPEQEIGGFNLDRPWESCMTISSHNAWAWGGAQDGVKPLEACLKMLISGAGGDGNVLLNVGPRPDGMIDPAQSSRLKEVGDWLAKNGASIYGTRGGPFKPGKWGASTRKGKRIYVHVYQFDGGQLELPAIPAKITSAKLLPGGKLKFQQSASGITLTVPVADQAPLDTLIALDIDKPVMEIPALTVGMHSASLAVGTKATASNVFQQAAGYNADQAIDGDMETRWATDAGTKQATLEVDLGKPQTFTKVAIHEWKAGGERIRNFELQYQNGGAWKTILTGTTIGPDFNKAFPAVTARVVRLNILAASEGPSIDEFGILK